MKHFKAVPARLRIFILGLLLLVALAFLLPALKEFNLIQMDYIQYWAAGYQTLRSHNPYQYETTAEIFRKFVNGIPNESCLYTPRLITLIQPFSLLTIGLSRMMWYFLGFGLLLYAADRVWALYNGSRNARWLALLLSLTFSPAFYALALGQLSPFTFAGMVFFLQAQLLPKNNRWKYWLMGAGAALMAMKPQGFYLFWVVLLLWSIGKKEWRVIFSAVLTLGAATLLVSMFVPNILFSFITTSLKNQPILYCTPTLGYWLREIFDAEQFALQYVAPLLGIAWLVIYWKRKHGAWDWLQQMPVLAFVSLITSPYAWTHDQVILLLPLLEIVILALNRPKRKLIMPILLGWLLLNAATIILHFWYPDCWFIWQAPFWLVIYLWLKKKLKEA
jgi:hypothetical protein